MLITIIICLTVTLIAFGVINCVRDIAQFKISASVTEQQLNNANININVDETKLKK